MSRVEKRKISTSYNNQIEQNRKETRKKRAGEKHTKHRQITEESKKTNEIKHTKQTYDSNNSIYTQTQIITNT